MAAKVDGLQVDDEILKLVKHAEAQGWTVTAGRNRLRFCSPLPDAPPVFVPTRRPQGKDLRAVLAMLYRAGLDDMPADNVRSEPEPEPAEPERAGREGDSQAMPVVNDELDIQSRVIADITARRQLGIRRYGTALQPHNGRSALLDLYEELVDAVMYAKQRLVEEGDAEEQKAWQQLAEEAERRLAAVEAERDAAVVRAETAELEIQEMRAAARRIMGA